MYNKVFLIGNLVRDPELRYTPSGLPVCKFVLAVNRQKKKDGGEQECDFINVVTWRRLAEICGEYLKKGRPAAIEGYLQIRPYKDKAGKERTFTEVVADNMQMLGTRPKEGTASSGTEKKAEEETPF
ncbi:hypothetical protein A2276_00250 [candidate division WOR-1 bacterium RIFOXYA12_FULL_43_27]|uniref:Single-stranded DNA-binding protein n=1 Tax=candidate division WOR-1 bacterium RIFOXYC2_FULL_46_14 TaxID=1802587 RepID=A0A1F4U4K6_UNCSA|nr:MAG: hypothetical protein A2276_00250 [candidate division WOR-1 bacterium RIFOXYA12_FULL_43_27]OGC20871.1 MAG: hypothetical protein A2292_07625 [candidate division WOR-1 bacterium RIFOXYB2_FULL_46_45]OGC31391.1 MAG: hypothetical protein A2232_03820 [candidate division WOR-1 bacterium RIFOXYA2_FULL_46_56]OGC39797.1 MAG: hypothetical protein A2438_04655 [candidate division WOR-1 bacterium RIFOXYC2_FULL_46_14]